MCTLFIQNAAKKKSKNIRGKNMTIQTDQISAPNEEPIRLICRLGIHKPGKWNVVKRYNLKRGADFTGEGVEEARHCVCCNKEYKRLRMLYEA